MSENRSCEQPPDHRFVCLDTKVKCSSVCGSEMKSRPNTLSSSTIIPPPCSFTNQSSGLSAESATSSISPGIPIGLKQVAQLLREGGGHGRRRPAWHRL